MKLNIKNFAITCAVWFGFAIFASTWWLLVRGITTGNFLTDLYPYYTISPAGSFIGLLYGLFDGAIGGLIFAWFYNLLTQKSMKEELKV